MALFNLVKTKKSISYRGRYQFYSGKCAIANFSCLEMWSPFVIICM